MANRYFERAGELEQGLRFQSTAASQSSPTLHSTTAVTGQ